MKKFIGTFLALTMTNFLAPAFADIGESIVFNPATGNYLITYDDDGSLEQITFIPGTKINPTIKNKLKLEQGGIVHYGYSLISGRDSQQDIVHIILDPVSSVTTSIPDIPLSAPPGQIAVDMLNVASYFVTPRLWRASMAYTGNGTAFRIGWRTKVANGMHPGKSADFGFRSRDLPGIIQGEIYGYAPGSQKIPGEILLNPNDGAFGQQYTELVFRKNFVSRLVAVPTIAVQDPFDAAALLERIQTQMHTWIAMNLLDASFSAQLDRYFQSAISAYRLNQPNVGKQQIEALREMIRKEQPDTGRDEEHESDRSHEKNGGRQAPLIDKLAARVLDFDLGYVTRRMDEDTHQRDKVERDAHEQDDGEHKRTSQIER
ncbi:MAG: hypothetical protein WCA64_06990 [Gallionella sp.]